MGNWLRSALRGPEDMGSRKGEGLAFGGEEAGRGGRWAEGAVASAHWVFWRLRQVYCWWTRTAEVTAFRP